MTERYPAQRRISGGPPITTFANCWRRFFAPATRSERSAVRSLLVGFLLELATEVYQFADPLSSNASGSLGYWASLATGVLGFYFFGRGFYEWNRANPRAAATRSRLPSVGIAIFVGGVLATAVLNIGLRNVGAGNTPAPLAWFVGGLLVLGVGSFFVTVGRRIAPFQRPWSQWLSWIAFAWSLVVSTEAGLVLGQEIGALFFDFFTDWPKLIRSLAPFVFTISPLFVSFALVAIVYAEAYRRVPDSAVHR